MGEVERGCGWRVAHGLYACGVGLGVPCDRLPLNIESCPACGAGLKVTRMPMKIDAQKLLGPHITGKSEMRSNNPEPIVAQDVLVANWFCPEHEHCAICNPELMKGPAYMLGVGREYSPQSFIEEARKVGVSKRIWAVPKELEVGKTWILLTHRDAGTKEFPEHEIELSTGKCVHCGYGVAREKPPTCKRKVPAIFYAYRPERIEYLIWRSEATPENIESLEKRGLTVVIVEDGDEKHMAGKAKLPKLKEPPKRKGQTPDEFTRTLG